MDNGVDNGEMMREKTGSLIEVLRDTLIMLAVPVAVFYNTQFVMMDKITQMNSALVAANILFYELAAFMLSAFLDKGSRGLRVEIALSYLAALVNAYVYRFRGSFVKPWDLFSVGTAANVAGNFDYTPDVHMVVSGVIFAALFILSGFTGFRFSAKLKKLPARLGAGALLMFAVSLLAWTVQRDSLIRLLDIYTIQFDSKGMVRHNGLAVNFMYQLKFVSVVEPEGYDPAQVEETLTAQEVYGEAPESGDGTVDNTGAGAEAETLPNIIVIMDEAFSDPAVDGRISTNEDYMPFIHSLQKDAENTISGYINVSVNGGNTPNSEFEFLTGNSMAFLPNGSIAFQQYLRRPVDSMAYLLKELGYYCLAMHPYKSSGWDRTRAYPLLGFDDMHFQDWFELQDRELVFVRKYISDESFFEVIEDEVDSLSESRPVFSFNVTMQNHSGYGGEDYDNFEQLISVNGIEEMDSAAWRINNYLSLVKYTDMAFEDMVERVKEKEKKTLLVFFGDHQPGMEVLDVLWEQNGKEREELSEEDVDSCYRVPFVIWANYDIQEASGIETSANYLGNLVLKSAGIPLGKYRSFLEDYSKEYPVVSAIRAVDSSGRVLHTGTDIPEELVEYQRVQYYELFDDKDQYR